MRDYEEHHGREEFAPSDLYGAVGVALAARLPRGRTEMATWSDGMPAWLLADMERMDREYRYFDAQTKRECARHGTWRTYEADGCPECSSEREGERGKVA